jgi:uncharacterized protein (DUF433 family)
VKYEPINYIVVIDGSPRLATRTRLRVMDIAAMIRGGSSAEWIVENHDLSLAQVYAAFAYYYDHKAEIDAEAQAAIEEFEESAKHGINAREHIAKIYARAGMTPPTYNDDEFEPKKLGEE